MWKRLRSPSGRTRGSRIARESAGRLGENEEGVAHRRRAEPLVSVEYVASPPPSGSARVSFARTSEPPWRSVIAMPQSAPAFSAGGRSTGSYASEVSRGTHSASPRLRSQRGYRSMRHRQRASDACLDLRERHEHGRTRHVRPRPRAPARATHGRPRPTASASSVVPGRVKLDLVDAASEAVVRPQHGRVLVRQGTPARAAPRRAALRARCTGTRPTPPPSRRSASTSGRFSAKRL